MGGSPAAVKAWLVREKGLLPKKPRRAERGEGWAEAMSVCRFTLANAAVC